MLHGSDAALTFPQSSTYRCEVELSDTGMVHLPPPCAGAQLWAPVLAQPTKLGIAAAMLELGQ
jgi:hypothetical protein